MIVKLSNKKLVYKNLLKSYGKFSWQRSYLVIAVRGSMARWRPQRFMGENVDSSFLSGTKETQHRWDFLFKKPPFLDFAWFDYFLKTASKYPFFMAIISKVEFRMVSRWVCFDLIYCHPTSNSSIIRKVSFTHLCVYQKKTDNYKPLHY